MLPVTNNNVLDEVGAGRKIQPIEASNLFDMIFLAGPPILSGIIGALVVGKITEVTNSKRGKLAAKIAGALVGFAAGTVFQLNMIGWAEEIAARGD